MRNSFITIQLTQGKSTIINSEDYELISSYKWSYNHSHGSCGYAVTNIYPTDRKHPKKIYMHRLIMEAKSGELIDHINQDTLDNQKSNLRFANRRINTLNNKINNPERLILNF